MKKRENIWGSIGIGIKRTPSYRFFVDTKKTPFFFTDQHKNRGFFFYPGKCKMSKFSRLKKAKTLPKKHDPWQLLGVEKGVGPKELKSAFQRAAKRHHPDAQGGSAEMFMAVQRAHESVKQLEASVFSAERRGMDSSSSRMGDKVRLRSSSVVKRARNPRLHILKEKHEIDGKGNVQLNAESYEKVSRAMLDQERFTHSEVYGSTDPRLMAIMVFSLFTLVCGILRIGEEEEKKAKGVLL